MVVSALSVDLGENIVRLGPPQIFCCQRWLGVLCALDAANHSLLQGRRIEWICDRHEQVIQDEHIIAVYWRA